MAVRVAVSTMSASSRTTTRRPRSHPWEGDGVGVDLDVGVDLGAGIDLGSSSRESSRASIYDL